MYILSSMGDGIYDSTFIERYSVVVKPDVVLIVAGYSLDHPPLNLGKYADKTEAKDALMRLFVALYSGERYFEMPLSRMFDGEERKHDARTKRKGGS